MGGVYHLGYFFISCLYVFRDAAFPKVHIQDPTMVHMSPHIQARWIMGRDVCGAPPVTTGMLFSLGCHV